MFLHTHSFRLAVLLVVFLAAGLLTVSATDGNSVWANGRATLISTQEQGPYRFEVSILPGRAIVNNTHLSLRIIAVESEEILTQAAVSISAVGPDTATDFGPIVADNAVLPQFFETTLPFDVPGIWQVSISVNTDLGEAAIQVPMDVREGRPINLILVAAIVVAVIAVAIWTYDRIKAGLRRRNAKGARAS